MLSRTSDENVEVSVLFDEDDDENGDAAHDLIDQESDDADDSLYDSEGETSDIADFDESKMHEDSDVGEESFVNSTTSLDLHDINKFWIQSQLRHLSAADADPLHVQKMASDVYDFMSSNISDRQLENKLVDLLGFERFSFIKVLLQNRTKIVWCMKLAHAESDVQRSQIESQMRSDPNASEILAALTHGTRDNGTASRTSFGTVKDERRMHIDAPSASIASAVDKQRVQHDAFWQLKPRQNIDLSSLEFINGGHTMTNDECKLPKNSEMINKKGYQEVHIPPSKPQSFVDGEHLVQISELPAWARPAFDTMTTLNRVQSRVYKTAFQSAENMLVCAPTGAGKTNVAMLTMLREIGLHLKADGSVDKDVFKMVYIAPMKALVQEVVANFSIRLKSFGLTVCELSGDVSLSKEQLADTQVIVTTPEKWDIVTRKAGERSFTQLVKLVIIDEIHLLHDSRGPVLETIVARQLRQIEQTQDLVRMVGISATLPNYEDVALFLRVRKETGLYFFDSSYRPVPLQQQYIGITHKKAFKRAEVMNEICYEKIMDQLGRITENDVDTRRPQNQVLVFVHSRKDTARTARTIRDMATDKGELDYLLKQDEFRDRRRTMLRDEAEKCKNLSLKEILPFGIGIHHAGMARSDRTTVEDLFADGHIQVLVSTATLAWGVNLPAYCVIIKGTQVYNPEKGAWTELSTLDMMQMLGRAGRPQYDTRGEGIIITTQKELQFYLSLLNEQLPVESQMVAKLPDMLNAEVALGTVTNMMEAVQWCGYLYLYVRMLRSPHIYGITDKQLQEDEFLEQRRADLLHSAAVLLDRHGLLRYERKTGSLITTDVGRVASYYYVSYTSIAVYNEHMRSIMSDIEIFRVFSLSQEFKHLRVREEEKIELAKLLDKSPVPVKESLGDGAAKINILLQAFISKLPLEGYALMADMVYVTQSAARLMRALFEIALRRGWAATARKCLTLCKEIEHQMWDAQTPLRQFESLSLELIRRIEGKDFAWDRLFDLEAPALGELVRLPKLGKQVYKCIHQLPRLDLQAHVLPVTRTTLRVSLTLTADFAWDETMHGMTQAFWVIVEDSDSENILHYEFFLLRQRFLHDDHHLTFTVPMLEPLPPQYFIRVLSDRWLGSESVLPVSFRQLLLPEKFAPPTELLDMQLLPISELASERYIRLYSDEFSYFNPIQTQVFTAAYRWHENMLVAAPTGAGKSVIAELTILKMLSDDANGRCVYLAPTKPIADQQYSNWSARFPSKINVSVGQLSGDVTADLKILAQNQIIITTPQHWDVLSRRWKTRKSVYDIRLFIADELQLLGNVDVGPTVEIVISRLRFISSQIQQPIRFIGLSTSVANAKDIGEWMGATAANIFSFFPSVRPVPLEIKIVGLDQLDFQSRFISCIKPAYRQLTELPANKPALVFASGRKSVRQIALDFIAYTTSEGLADRFLSQSISLKILDDIKAKMQSSSLFECVQHGVAFIHNGVSASDRLLVSSLYRSGAVRVVVCDYDLCWSIDMTATLVIIMGAEVFDGTEHRYVDMSMTDIVQILGRASRPIQDSNSNAVLYCPSSRREYYKKFLYQPFPVESQLDQQLADHLNAEIVTKRVNSFQDAVDYLTWTFLYYRLMLNPNYYGLTGITDRHFSDHLSELVENTLDDLSQAKCVAIEDETSLSALNLGLIAAYYYLHYTTVEVFAKSLQKRTKLKGLLEILCAATEFDRITVRNREERSLQALARHLPAAIPASTNFTDGHVKTQVLLQCHFSRIPLTAAVQSDLELILPDASRLLQAMVDVLSSNGWLIPALGCMEMSQMVTQAQWNTDSPLMQLPHFDKLLVERSKQRGINNVNDLIDMDDDERLELLSSFSTEQIADIAAFCNAYPDIDMQYKLVDADAGVTAGEPVTVLVTLARELEENDIGHGALTAITPRYPGVKTEGWWLVIGNTLDNELLAIKRVTFNKPTLTTQLEFSAPENAGSYQLVLNLMCDAYIGIDQEITVPVIVHPAAAMQDD